MAASEMALGEDHPATRTTQPEPTHRSAQLSGEFYGEGTDHGYKQPIKVDEPDAHDHGPDV